MHTKEYIEVNGEEIPLELTWEATPCECDTDRGTEKWTEWKCEFVENMETCENVFLDEPLPPWDWAKAFMEKYLSNGFEPPR